MKRDYLSVQVILWVLLVGIPACLWAQEEKSAELLPSDSQWIIVLSTSTESFSETDLQRWEEKTGQKPSVYKNPLGVYRAIIHTPEYWPKIKAYRDSLKDLGLESIRLHKLYKNQFIYRRWQELEDMGEISVDP